MMKNWAKTSLRKVKTKESAGKETKASTLSKGAGLSSTCGLTAVGVDVVGLQEADSQVVQDRRFVQVTEGCQVVLAHQDVRVPQEGQRVLLRTHWVLQRLRQRCTIRTHSQKTKSERTIRKQSQNAVLENTNRTHCQNAVLENTIRTHSQKTKSERTVRTQC